ncbi:unnamed protein product, partial [marine sediment metagenome]
AATVSVGSGPTAVAVNPVTGKVYVAKPGSDQVTVIDGTTNNTTNVAVGDAPLAVAINPVTNRIYVANNGSNDVTVIDGATNVVLATVSVETDPMAVAVNPTTNKIYVASNGSLDVTVIDGATNGTTTVLIAGVALALAVNQATNKIYVSHVDTVLSWPWVVEIDGATNIPFFPALSGGNGPVAVAVNPITGKIYAANSGGNNLGVITTHKAQSIPLATAISPLPGDTTRSATPAFTFNAASGYAPTAPPVRQIYYQADTWTGQWRRATPQGSSG